MSLKYNHTKPLRKIQADTTTKADKLQPGTAVLYGGLPTRVIRAPWAPMGVEVVMLAYVPWLVPVNDTDLQIMQEPPAPTMQK